MTNLDQQRNAGNAQPGETRRAFEPGNAAGNGARPQPSTSRTTDRTWRPVKVAKPAYRPETTATPESPPAFRRVDNGEPRFRGTTESDPFYSPVYYHFTRFAPHEQTRPWSMWLVVGAIFAAGTALLLFMALPGMMHNQVVVAPTDTPLYATYPAAGGTLTPEPTITIKPDPTPIPTPQPTFRLYIVKRGDTVSKIANRYGLKVWEIVAANPSLGGNADGLIIGMTLNIPKPGQMPQPTPGS